MDREHRTHRIEPMSALRLRGRARSDAPIATAAAAAAAIGTRAAIGGALAAQACCAHTRTVIKQPSIKAQACCAHTPHTDSNKLPSIN